VAPSIFQQALGIEGICTGAGAPPKGVRALQWFPVSVVSRQYSEPLKWASQFLRNK
jgi:hypothetical protein